jgi:hypothetical protein
MRGIRILAAGVAWWAATVSAAYAQAAIAGVVKDTSGAVLPGVTVEAASPALIEKVRSVVSDGSGQYRIVDLRPGVYSVTFTLPGFNTVKREGIELSGSFIAQVDVELRVGALEETVTVTGETPVVDVQSARGQQTIDNETLRAIPTARAYQNVIALVPAITNPTGPSQDVGGDRGDVQPRYSVHGAAMTDSRIQMDGMTVGSTATGGSSGTMYITPVGMSEEVVVNTSGALADADTGGVIVNVIPREGGNFVRGILFVTGANSAMQSNNYTQELKDRGLRAPNTLDKIWDVNPAVGGPVVRDRVWYFLNVRNWGATNFIAGMYPNRNAGNPDAWTYEPDLSRQAKNDSHWWSTALRLTWQVSARHKLNVFWDEQRRCVSCEEGGGPTLAPETSVPSRANPNRVSQATWTSPLTNRILLEAGISQYLAHWGALVVPEFMRNPAFVPVTEQAGIIPGLLYKSNQWRFDRSPVTPWRASFSYVTGAQNLKVGMNGTHFYKWAELYSAKGLTYRFNNGVPNQLTQFAHPYSFSANMENIGAYAQDQWTVSRLTVSGGVRYDHWHASSPEQQFGPSPFVSTPITFAAEKHSSFNDISPRLSGAYDLFGTGRTALKVTLGRYVAAMESDSAALAPFGSAMNPIVRLATSTTRAWTDANRNFLPDCDLTNPGVNGECGAMANQNFGRNVANLAYDPEVIAGWGVRPYSWEFSAGVQQQLLPRVSASIGYFRRWYGNFAVTDNLATAVGDYSLFALPVPTDSRLANSGGTVAGVPDVVPGRFGLVSNRVTAASNYGEQIQRWNGIDASVNARLVNGAVLQAGVSTGRLILDNCDVAAQLPEVMFSPTYSGVTNTNVWTPLEYCRAVQPFQTQIKGLGSYTVPKIDVQVSATVQNLGGPEIKAFYNAPNALVAPVLGRNLSGNAANISVNLLRPLSTYGDRLTQVDLRLAKIVSLGRSRTQIGIDLFNLFNSSGIQTINNTYGPQWQTPTGTLSPRLLKVAAQLDF